MVTNMDTLDAQGIPEPTRHPDIGQPCAGYDCDGRNSVCDDCGQAISDWHQSMKSP